MDTILQPVSPPTGLFLQYIRDTPTTLVLKEKVLSWSGSDFGIKDLDGVLVARCKGKFPTITGRRVIVDAQDKPLYHLREKLWVVDRTFIAEDEAGNEVFRLVKKRFSLKAKMEITYKNHKDNTTNVLSLRGGYWGVSADITLGSEGSGPVVAQINRNRWTAKDLLADKQTYYVTIAPGVDIILIAGICICFDESMNDSSGGGG